AVTLTSPGRKPSRSRSAFGMTRRPALSMVARMVLRYHRYGAPQPPRWARLARDERHGGSAPGRRRENVMLAPMVCVSVTYARSFTAATLAVRPRCLVGFSPPQLAA